MAHDATLNVRFPGELVDLKRRGDAVLAREGVSASSAVRGLYRYLDEAQQLPEWLWAPREEDAFEKRRATMRSLVGIVSLPDDFDVSSIKDERLSRIEL